jgi:hypothetical protein
MGVTANGVQDEEPDRRREIGPAAPGVDRRAEAGKRLPAGKTSCFVSLGMIAGHLPPVRIEAHFL